MRAGNDTSNTEFILLGHYSSLKHPVLFFFLLLFIYMASLVENTLLILIVKKDVRLHTPMYFFLCSLAFQEMCYTSVTVPTLLMILLRTFHAISFTNCAAQIYFLHFLGVTECLLLAVMAYDRYVAICKPLHYSMLMSRKLCVALTAGCWICGCLESLVLTIMTSQLPFCGLNEVRNFFCDIPPLLKLACKDTHLNETVLSIAGFLVVLCPFVFILMSYVFIAVAILRIKSTQGRRKAFSTCSSHLIVVCIFYGTVIYMYVKPASMHSSDWDRLVSLVYTVLTPTLNPLIYSLKNKEVKAALKIIILKRGFWKRPE